MQRKRQIFTVGIFSWGLCPQTPRVYRFKQKNEVYFRSERSSLTTPPSFLCPTQALGFALQHHPILLVGNEIFRHISIRKSIRIAMRHLSFCISKLNYLKIFLIILNYCPTKGSHLKIAKI